MLVLDITIQSPVVETLAKSLTVSNYKGFPFSPRHKFLSTVASTTHYDTHSLIMDMIGYACSSTPVDTNRVRLFGMPEVNDLKVHP